MTANQIAAKDARTRERAERETRRSNREKEANTRADMSAKYGNDVYHYAQRQARGQDPAGDKGWGGIITKSIERGADIIGKLFSPVAKVANDPKWYIKEPQLVEDVGTFSFNYPVGVQPTPTTLHYVRKPGFVILRYRPVLGKLGDGNTVGNVSAYNFYSWIRHANSGSRNYDATDLMMYIVCVSSAYSLVSFLSKLYSIARTYKFHNRAYAQALFINLTDGLLTTFAPDLFTSICSNLAGFRAMINRVILKLGVCAMPKDISLTERWTWLNGVIVKDDLVKSSTDYHFKPEGFFKFAVNQNTGSYAQYSDDFEALTSGGEIHNIFDLEEAIGNFINPLFTDEDLCIMSGDILKAYGESGVYHINTIPEDYHIEAAFSLEVLSQIKNASVSPVYPGGTTSYASITQDSNGVIMYGSMLGVAASGDLAKWPSAAFAFATANQRDRYVADVIDSGASQLLVNMYKDDVSPADMMVATRLMHTIVPQELPGSSNTGIFSYVGVGSEVILELIIHNPVQGAPNAVQIFAGYNSLTGFAQRINILPKCEWAPSLLLYYDAGTGNVYDNTAELHNFTFISRENLTRLSEVAIFSETSVPLSGLTKKF